MNRLAHMSLCQNKRTTCQPVAFSSPVVVEALDALNYPGEAATLKKAPNIYLQAGAFQAKSSADKLKRDIETTFMLQRLNAKVRVLESELEAEVKLHKVWIGPILSTNREAMISTILSQMGLAVQCCRDAQSRK